MRLPCLLALTFLISVVASTAREPDPLALFSCEGDGFDDWQITGKAFGLGPQGELPPGLPSPVRGYCGESFASSATVGREAQGALLSPELTLPHAYLSFRLGGSGEKVGVELLVADQVVLRAQPEEGAYLKRVTWKTSAWAGQKVRVRIFDESETGFLLFDHLISHSYPNPIFPNTTRQGRLYEPGLQAAPAVPGMIIPKGTTAHLFAAHEGSAVTSPTAITIAADGAIYLSETHRFRQGVEDNRDHLYWLLDDIAAQSTEDRKRLHEKWQHKVPLARLTEKSEVVRVLRDRDGDLQADESSVFADGFNDLLDGTAAGVFAYEDVVYFACIPHLWALSDLDGDGQVAADERVIIQDGFGTRVSLSGHDLNGFALGPNGRLYGTIGDRSLNLTTLEGTRYTLTDQGAAFRFDPDGSNFEIFHTGLRNPKEIAFNEFGDAFSVDNNADMGDLARLVYLVEGADSGWRTDHQNLHTFHREIGLEKRPPNSWMDERCWDLAHPGQPAFLLPPIAHFSNGPSGLAFQPGTALGGDFADHFFLCDYKGGPSASGVHTFTVARAGASYQLGELSKLAWGIGATDLAFAFDGTAYLSDFGTGWKSAPQGRVIALTANDPHPQATEVATLVAQGFRGRSSEELRTLLSHVDQRVRLRAQIALAEKPDALPSFYSLLHLRNELLDLPPENLLLPPLDFDDELRDDNTPLARLHATWGLAMLARKEKDAYATAALLGLLRSPDPELRAQAAKALGEAPVQDASRLIAALTDSSDRVRFFAALALARLRVPEAFDPLLALALSAFEKNDPYLRHAAVMGLAGCGNEEELLSLSGHALPAMRLPVMLALHRLRSVGVNRFLFDHTPEIRDEAIRLIHDTPLESARPALIAVLQEALSKENSDLPPLIWRRLLHSTFRLGTAKNAARLLEVAQTPQVPLATRREALRLIQQWTAPHPVDQSLGRHAPQPPRPLSEIQPLLEDSLLPLLAEGSPLLNEAIALISHYELAPAKLSIDDLLTLAQNEQAPAKARQVALKLLAAKDDFALTPLLIKLLDQETSPTLVRLACLRLLTERNARQSFPYLSQALQAADLSLRQGAAIQLASHPHPEVPLLITAYFDRLREQDAQEKTDRTIELEMTIAAQVSSSFAAQESLRAYQESLGTDPLRENLGSLFGGNAARGAELFASHPAGQCARCHAVEPDSAQTLAGPNLSDIGKKPRRYLLESLLQPSAVIAGQAPIAVTLTNGETLAGALLAESENHLDILIEGEAWRLLPSEIARTQRPDSPMPAMGALLSGEDLRDLVAYLATLQKPSSIKKPLAQTPKRYHPSSRPNPSDMADETTPTPAPADTAPAETAPAETAPAAGGVPAGIDPAVWELGKKKYDLAGSCTTCHQPTGLGLPGAFPPLAESEWVLGPVDNLIRIQLRGLAGPIEVKGQTYNSAMPAMATQTDEEIAAVLTYVRNSFGNKASAVTPDMVEKFRDEVGQPMLTAAELIDPATAPVEAAPPAVAEDGSIIVPPAVIGNLPKADSYMSFPNGIFAIIFVLIILLAGAKFLLSKSK